MKKLLTVLLAACLALSLAACGAAEKAPDTAVEERLVTVFREDLETALNALDMEVIPDESGEVTKIYSGRFFWCGEALGTRMAYFDGQARHYSAEQTLEVGEEAEARVQKCTELFQKQFGEIHSVAWDIDADYNGNSVIFASEDGAEATDLAAEEKLGQLWENPEETPVVRIRYLLPYLPSDSTNIQGTRVAQFQVHISPEDQAHVRLSYTLINFDVQPWIPDS